MSTSVAQEAQVWLRQAASDARAAEALLLESPPMRHEDTGCHVAAMCAQTIEKGLKGYVLLNGGSPALDHRPDKYLAVLLTPGSRLLRFPKHYPHLSRIFDAKTKATLRQLFDWTPGGRGARADTPNTEYPWKENGNWRHAPCGAHEFSDRTAAAEWIGTARRVRDGLFKLWIAEDRVTR